MTSRSRTLGPLAALAALAALAGCGGSGPSKAEFVKKADLLCVETNNAHPPKPNPRNATEAAAVQAEEIAIRTELDRKLKALKVPDGAKSDFDAYNAGTQKILAVLNTMKTDAAAGREKKYVADSQQFTTASAEREKAAIKLGFKTCGRKKPTQ